MNASQRRSHERYLLKKWGERILKHQVKERLRGRISLSALSLARYYEAGQKNEINARRNQALRASGQVAQAQ
jgi:hypothetical protein